MSLNSKALMGPEGCSQLIHTAHLLRHLHQHFQWEQVVLGWAQQIWPNADGKVVDSRPAGCRILADVVEQGEQLLEEE